MEYYQPDYNLTGMDYEGDYYAYDESVYLPIPPSPEETFIHYLYVIVFPYFLLFGTIGNIIGIALMKRYSKNVWSSCLYMTLLLPMELIKLYVECGNAWFKKIHNDKENLSADILLLSNAVCKVYSFTYSFILHEAEWLAVAVVIETVIAIRNPLWIYRMCTRERATAIVLFISVLLISLNLHFFWTTGLTRPGDDPAITVTLCTYINELSDHFRDYIWPVINFIIGSMLPFIVLLVCISWAIPRLRLNDKEVKEQNKCLEKYFLDIKTLHELKRCLYIICVVYILTLICNILDTALLFFTMRNVIDFSFETVQLIKALLATITYFFLSHKFWIFFAFCTKFRIDVIKMAKATCRPLMKKYYNTHSNRCALLDRNQEVAESWAEGDNIHFTGKSGTSHA